MKNITTNVSVNKFVRRQIRGSGKSYTDTLNFEDIAHHAEEQLKKGSYRTGYRDGVLVVQAAKNTIKHFICPFIKINEKTEMKAKIVRRRPKEEPYIQIRALNGKSLSTASVDLILYRNDVLAETTEQTSDSDWELISFHAIPKGIDEMPMGPVTMMRNQLQITGGTKAHYTTQEWAKSVKFWQKYAVLDENHA